MLETIQLTKRFNGHVAVNGLNLSIQPGEVFALLGPNGAGKTTTIKLLLGFHTPDAGEARINGASVAADPIAARRQLAYIPEQVMLYGLWNPRRSRLDVCAGRRVIPLLSFMSGAARGTVLGLAALLCCVGLSSSAADWPRWRGPDLDGVSAETNWFRPWPNDGPPVLWRANVGIGFATVSVSQGRLYTLGNANDVDTVFCLDAATGREQWRHSYPCALDARYYEGGPGSTPTVEGEAVYTLSKKGHLFRLDVTTGRSVWARNLTNDLDLKLPEWSLAGSPLVEGDLLILNAGSAGTAVDKHTGRTVWTSGPGPGGYATPVPFEHQGRRAIAIFSAKHLVAVEPRTGREWWRHPWESSRDVNAADPLIAGDQIFLASSSGSALLQLRDGPPTVLWGHTNRMRNYFNPAVLVDGHLYAIDGTTHRPTTLTCLDWATGQLRWSEPGFGSGGLMAADGRLIVFDKGQLSLIRAEPAAFKLLARAQVLGGKCWTAPVLSHGRIYVRNAAGDLVCVPAGGDGTQTP